MLEDARTRALANLQSGTSTALGNLATGYDTARTDITGGADRARTALTSGYDRARGDLDTQYGRAEDAITGYLDPFISSGRNAQNLYDTALGTGGTPEERASFYENYAENDPFRAYRDEQANRALEQQFNARGLGTSGRMATAVSRASLERGTTDLNAYLDRLARQGELGGQYAARAGSEIAGLRSNLGNQLSGLEQNRGTQMAGLEERTGTNLGQLGYRYGSDQASINQGNGQFAANLEYGHGQQLAGNRINLGNAVASSRSVLPNLLMQGAGLAIRGMTPGLSGMSAFQSMLGGKSKDDADYMNRLIPTNSLTGNGGVSGKFGAGGY